jgi:hypothetical protein
MKGRTLWPAGWRAVVLLIVGSVMGANLIAPAVAHVAGWTHNWDVHIKPKAEPRYANAVAGTDKAKDSDKLDGVNSTVLMGGFDAQTITGSTSLTTTVTDVATITVDAPSAGFVILTGNGMFTANHTSGTADFLRVWLTTASGTTNFDNLTFHEVPSSAPTGNYSVPLSITRIFPVVAGPNSFYMTADANSGAGGLNRHNLTGIFSSTQL